MRLTQPNIERYRPIIYKLARSFHRSTGLEYDDLVAQGNLIFCEIQKGYTKKQGVKFSTFLYRCLVNRFITYIKTQQRYRKHHVNSDFIESSFTTKDINLNFAVRKSMLSKEAKTVIRVLLESPQEFFNLTGVEKLQEVKTKLYKKCRSLGWHRPKVLMLFKEIKTFLLS